MRRFTRLALRVLSLSVVLVLLASCLASLPLPGAQEDRSDCYWTTVLFPYVECAPEAPNREVRAQFYNLWLFAPFGFMWIAALIRHPVRIWIEMPGRMALVLLIDGCLCFLVWDLWQSLRQRLA
jgi:hypothetical protein